MTSTDHEEAALETETTQEAEGQATPEATEPILGGEVAKQQEPTEGKTEPEGDPAPSDEPPRGAPEAYEFEAPQGQEFDKAVLGGFEEVARELDLTQDGAQAILTKVAPLLAEQARTERQAIIDGWATELAADKELGGDKLSENLADGDRAITRFGSPELIDLLNGTGLIGAPEIVRFAVKVGQAFREERVLIGGPAKKKDEDLNDPSVINRRMGWPENG